MATYFAVTAVPDAVTDEIDPLGVLTVSIVIVKSLAGEVPPSEVPAIVKVFPAVYNAPGTLIVTEYTPFLRTTSNDDNDPEPPVADKLL
jgi:hypothetical protein